MTYKYLKREAKTKKTRTTFLIVCEGAETEPRYFKSFPIPQTEVVVKGVGMVTFSLVEKAVELRGNPPIYDQVWCVFDHDSNPKQQFNAALNLAQQQGIKVAYSVEAFEIWYILHFQYRDTAESRNKYEEILNKLLQGKDKYTKTHPDMYEILKPLQSEAIKNAKRLFETHQSSCTQPYNANPCTTVYQLVEELNKHLRP